MNLASLRARDYLIVASLTVAAIAVHGYHPATEDAEIYTPGIVKVLNPSLFPHNAEFFASHAKMTLFPELIAASIRLTHLPLNAALLAWHVASIFAVLLGCTRIARLCFAEEHAVWCGVALVAALLSLSVAGTALYIMDPYLTTRSLSTPGTVLAVAAALQGRTVATVTWILFIAAMHPLMAIFAIVLVTLLVLLKHWSKVLSPAQGLAALSLFPPVTPEYREVLRTRSYFFLTNWAWYEWLGLLGPFAILAWLERIARRHALSPMSLLCRALLWFSAIFFAMGLVVSMPGPFERFAEIQPERYLQLLYVLMFLLVGGLLGKFVMQRHVWRWAALFVPLCAGMSFAQLQIAPATPHLELPWRASPNAWVQTFEWIRVNTPEQAYFALNPNHLVLPGEDQHGFRAIAQRSMLADAKKDSGAASMFPGLSGEWLEQVNAQRGWEHFQREDFVQLKQKFGVDWVVLQRPGVGGLLCPYANEALLVCKIE